MEKTRRAVARPQRPGETCQAEPGRWVPVVAARRCEGKGDCVGACPYDVFDVGPKPEALFRSMPFVSRWKLRAHGKKAAFAPRAEACPACGPRVVACPEHAVELVPPPAPGPGRFVTLGLALVASLASPACTADLGSPVDWEDVVETEDGVLLWARARGAEAGLPLLLVLHGGPGYAMQGLLHQRLPELESSFVVVEYDQRGAGLSYDPGIDPATMTLATFVSDAESVLSAVEGALGRPPAPVVVMGHSMGTMIGLDLVAADPPRFAAYVGVGQVVQVVENEQASWDFAHASAEAAALLEATTELDCVGRPLDDFSYPGSSDPSCDPELDGFEVTSRWVGWFGGAYWGEQGTDWLDEEILMLEAYQGSEDAWIDGSEFSAFLFDDPAVLSWDARVDHASPDVPVRLLTGRHDYDTPAPLVEAYAEGLDDPDALRWFEDSAHFPFLEEPDAFLEAMLEVADDLASQ